MIFYDYIRFKGTKSHILSLIDTRNKTTKPVRFFFLNALIS